MNSADSPSPTTGTIATVSESAIEYPPSWEGPTTKLSVTVPESLAAVVRQRAGTGNVSGYVTDALVRQIELDRLGELVDLLAETHGGHSTADELAVAEAQWPDA